MFEEEFPELAVLRDLKRRAEMLRPHRADMETEGRSDRHAYGDDHSDKFWDVLLNPDLVDGEGLSRVLCQARRMSEHTTGEDLSRALGRIRHVEDLISKRAYDAEREPDYTFYDYIRVLGFAGAAYWFMYLRSQSGSVYP
jgi:hypothetical protein